MRNILITLVLLSIFPLLLFAQSSGRRDGNWWLSLNKSEKNFYTAGFFDGTIRGSFMTSTGFTKKESSCIKKSQSNFNANYNKYFLKTANKQIVAGLDNFYTDNRNRKIMLFDATWIIVNEIAGGSKGYIDEMIKEYREHSY